MTEVELSVSDDGVSVTVTDHEDAWSGDKLDSILTRACDTAVRLYCDTSTLRAIAEQEDDGA